MMDIDLELRMQLMRAQPELRSQCAASLIRGIASSCLEVRDDAIACGELDHEDFVTFCHIDGVALVAIFREAAVEFFAFAANQSFIRDADQFTMIEVQDFMQMAQSRYHAPDKGLVISMSVALPWMEQHQKTEKDEESKDVA